MVHRRCEGQLPNIIRAICPSPSFSYRLNTGKQDRNKHTDNANNYQQLNNGKAVPCDYYFHRENTLNTFVSITFEHSFLINRNNNFKITTMWEKRDFIAQTQHIFKSNAPQNVLYFLCRSKKLATLRLRFSYIVKYADSAGTLPIRILFTLGINLEQTPRTMSQKLSGMFSLRGFLFCTAVHSFCPTK